MRVDTYSPQYCSPPPPPVSVSTSKHSWHFFDHIKEKQGEASLVATARKEPDQVTSNLPDSQGVSDVSI